MKIYTKIILDKDDNLIYEKSIDYFGKIESAMGIHYDYDSTRSAKRMEKQAKREKKLAEKRAKKQAKSGNIKDKDKNKTIIVKDSKGIFHFNGNFNNADALGLALDQLPDTYSALLQNDKAKVCAIYEKVFDHKSFTGRSGTFYGYEGLGSIYWHMVSKLLIAVQELIWKTKPDLIIETGVAYGWSSQAILSSIHNRKGKLISVDMPMIGQND